MNRLFGSLLIGLLGCAGVFAAAPGAESVSIENEFIRAVVNRGPREAGRFSIRTTGGDPSRPASREQHLIFGGNAPWTSYTTVQVDGEKFVFGGPTSRRAGHGASYGKAMTLPTAENKTVTTVYRCGDIEVAQELGLVRGPSTRMLDTIGITYRLTNHGVANHQVGVRVLLDTMCGSNDAAPMRAGRQAITTATAMAGSTVPDYWQAFDSLAKPTVISQGTLRGTGLTVPDKVIFADWGTLADEPWEPVLTPEMGFIRKGETDPDTAVALFWNPQSIDPEKTASYTTAYGIGDVSLQPGNLTLGLTAPAEATYEHERTDTFTITGYLQNAGGFEARDVSLTFTLPAGLTLVNGSKLKETYDSLKPGETAQESWTVRPNGKFGGKAKLALAVASANIEANQIARDVQLNVPTPTLQCTPRSVSVTAGSTDLPTLVLVQVNLKPAENLQGVRFTLQYDPKVVRPLGKPFGVTRGSAFAEDDRLLNWHYDDSVDGRLVIVGRRNQALPMTQAEVNLATIKFQVVGAGKTALKLLDAVALPATTDKGEEHPVQVADGEIIVTAEPK